MLTTASLFLLLLILALLWGNIDDLAKLLNQMRERGLLLFLLWAAGMGVGRVFGRSRDVTWLQTDISRLIPTLAVATFLGTLGFFIVALSWGPVRQARWFDALLLGVNTGFNVLLFFHGFLTAQFLLSPWAQWIIAHIRRFWLIDRLLYGLRQIRLLAEWLVVGFPRWVIRAARRVISATWRLFCHFIGRRIVRAITLLVGHVSMLWRRPRDD